MAKRRQEPQQLRRGKRFHKLIQDAFADPNDLTYGAEKPVKFEYPPDPETVTRSGRIDVYWDLSDGSGACIFEIKATLWDRVKHRRRLLRAHRRQLMKYVDQFLLLREISVVAALIYPNKPVGDGLVEEIENYMGEWAKKFYADRSALVHGGELPDLMYGQNRHNSKLALADIIFTQCAYRQLELLDYWPSDYAKSRFRKNVVRFLISNKERFDEIRRFTLRREEDQSALIRDYLYTIQTSDASVSRADCDETLKAVLDIGIAGLARLSRMARFRTAECREVILAYRTRFNDMIEALPVGEPLNVFQRLRDVPKGREGKWDETVIRGTPFGRARLITLDVLISASYSIDELRTELIYV